MHWNAQAPWYRGWREVCEAGLLCTDMLDLCVGHSTIEIEVRAMGSLLVHNSSETEPPHTKLPSSSVSVTRSS